MKEKRPLSAQEYEAERVTCQEQLAALQRELEAEKARSHELNAKLQANSFWGTPCYEADAMRNYFKNMSWMQEARFARAYARGMNSGHQMGRPKGSQDDIHIEWRVHVILWAAHHGMRLEGDFVECGVNTGIFSLAACDYLDFATAQGRKFWLFDTYRGIPEEQMSAAEKETRPSENAFYPDCYEQAKANFAPYSNVNLVKGMVPDSLHSVNIERVCYLSLDMNIARPEVAALEFFWDKLVPGAAVVLDDYGWQPYQEQQVAMDAFAKARGIKIATLPTGQGLLIKS